MSSAFLKVTNMSKGVLNYKKPAFWIIVAAIAAGIVIGVCFLTDSPGTALTKWDTDTVSMKKVMSDVNSLSVKYMNKEVTCNEADMNRFIATMDKIKVGRRPLSKSRNEGWSKVFSITVNGHVKLNFNDKFDEIWVDNGVKPSFSYRIKNPSVAEELLLDYNFTAKTDWGKIDMASLRSKYPEYFDLSTFKGLEVYVWQLAPSSYSFGLMPGTNRDKEFDELLKMKGASFEEMRAILSAYDVDEENISVIPWMHPVSSYIAEYWTRGIDEDQSSFEKRQREYVDRIRRMLFGNDQNGGSELPNFLTDIKTTLAYANWTGGGMMNDCLNGEKMIISSVRHLPVYKLDTLEDLNRFKESYKDILTLDQGYDEVPSFNEVTASYDNSFFADRTLILAYVEASSGSFRYAIQNVSYGGSTFCLNVVQTNHPEVGTTDMAGWFVIAEVLDSDIANITEFDATLQ